MRQSVKKSKIPIRTQRLCKHLTNEAKSRLLKIKMCKYTQLIGIKTSYMMKTLLFERSIRLMANESTGQRSNQKRLAMILRIHFRCVVCSKHKATMCSEKDRTSI